jgi:hypothetical protein
MLVKQPLVVKQILNNSGAILQQRSLPLLVNGHPQDANFNFPHKQAVTSSRKYGIVFIRRFYEVCDCRSSMPAAVPVFGGMVF